MDAVTTIEKNIIPELNELLWLYSDAGWSAYVAEPDKLLRSVEKSPYVLCARQNGRLIGLLRAVGDGESIMYMQDIIVLKEFRRQGIGRRLTEEFLREFSSVRQKVLICDILPENISFYESCGFKALDKCSCTGFVHFSPVKKQRS